MPTTNVRITDYADSLSHFRELHRTTFISFESWADSSSWSRVGPGDVFRGGVSDADSSSLAALHVRAPASLLSEADSSAVVFPRIQPPLLPTSIAESDSIANVQAEAPLHPQLFVSFSDDADSSGTISPTVNAFFLVSEASSDSSVRLSVPIPPLREATETEIPGTINFIRNPSLEYEIIGLQDWESEAGTTLARNNAEGPWEALVNISSGSGFPLLKIRSQEGLNLSSSSWWSGSIFMRGNAALVNLMLRFVYLDGTEVDTDRTPHIPSLIETRVLTEAFAHNPAKVLSRIDLLVEIPQEAGAVWLRFDRAQIEQATTGGATTYADGDQGFAHSWSGTPGLSMSVRQPVEMVQ